MGLEWNGMGKARLGVGTNLGLWIGLFSLGSLGFERAVCTCLRLSSPIALNSEMQSSALEPPCHLLYHPPWATHVRYKNSLSFPFWLSFRLACRGCTFVWLLFTGLHEVFSEEKSERGFTFTKEEEGGSWRLDGGGSVTNARWGLSWCPWYFRSFAFCLGFDDELYCLKNLSWNSLFFIFFFHNALPWVVACVF